MLISVTEDVRVVLIKLAERTYALRELDFSRKERQERVAREILTIYLPPCTSFRYCTTKMGIGRSGFPLFGA